MHRPSGLVLRADELDRAHVTSGRVLHLDAQVGQVKPGLLADLAAFDGNPVQEIGALRRVRLVMKSGVLVRQP